MFEFRRLCRQVESLDGETYAALLATKTVEVVAALSAITKNGHDGVRIFQSFILCSIAADGRLDRAEYELIKQSFSAVAGEEVSYEDAVAMFRDMGLDRAKDFKNVVDEMVDILGMISLDLKSDIILVCMLVCAVDGKISSKEKKWIKQLAR